MSEKEAEFLSYRKGSRVDYGIYSDGLTFAQIKLGAILRVADSLELIAKSKEEYEATIANLRIRLEQRGEAVQHWRDCNTEYYRSNSALRGHLTRKKAEITALKAELAELKREGAQ